VASSELPVPSKERLFNLNNFALADSKGVLPRFRLPQPFPSPSLPPPAKSRRISSSGKIEKPKKSSRAEKANKISTGTLVNRRGEKPRQAEQSLVQTREKRERKERILDHYPTIPDPKPREKQSPKPILKLDAFGQPRRGPGRPPEKWRQQQQQLLLQRRFSTPVLKTQPSNPAALKRRSSSFGYTSLFLIVIVIVIVIMIVIMIMIINFS
jgi:hypothetical protein